MQCNDNNTYGRLSTKRDESDLKWMREALVSAQQSPFNVTIFKDIIQAMEQRRNTRDTNDQEK
jgi:hypothetical protein